MFQMILVTKLLLISLLSDPLFAQSLEIQTAFPQLVNLTYQPNTALHRSPFRGGQNFTHCCLLAVNASLEVTDNGTIVPNPQNYFIDASINQLVEATKRNQFPCGAEWDGDHAGAPIVEVPYGWLAKNCPGWELSRRQWISPFVGFLLPAVVFCLTIPRRKKLGVWKCLFLSEMDKVVSWLFAPFAVVIAGIIVSCDTVFWLSTCFAFAGPMLMSGFYEAWLDSVVISFLRDKMDNRQTTLDMRTRLLFVILCGNLDLEPDVRKGDQQRLAWTDKQQESSLRWPNFRKDPNGKPRNASSPWTHIENLIHPLRMYRDSAIKTPRQTPIHDQTCIVPDCMVIAHMEETIPRDDEYYREIGRTKTRLRTMLACQYSFGATVGAPIVFFLGAFVFTIVDALSRLGDNDTSLSLAFGMWYMIIPHLSIVSGLLLAGNNPNTFEGVVAHEFGESEKLAVKTNAFASLYELAYDSRYKPQWLWFRGRSKRQWIEKVLNTYEMTPPHGRRGSDVFDEDMATLKKNTTPTLMSWSVILGMTLLLMGVPYVLAFLTGFYTPEVGISCRSLTFTVYAITQFCQIFLWLWAYAGPPPEGNYLKIICKGGLLDRNGFWTPSDASPLFESTTRFSIRAIWVIIWYSLAAVFGISGVFTTIGGTMMQLMGVYRSGKCDLTANYWTKFNENDKVIVSTNYALEIEDASRYWESCGIAAILFLGTVCFGGWWYQRRLRGLFRNIVDDLDNPHTDRADVVKARAEVVRDTVVDAKSEFSAGSREVH